MERTGNLKSRSVVPNRIFLAYQWQVYRPLFESVCADLHKTYPVHFYALGRTPGQQAVDLLERIKTVLLSSTAAVFDASRGNANVSLEYGLAAFVPNLPVYLLIDQNTMPNHINIGTPIISDLAGTAQNRWDITDRNTLRTHLEAIAKSHPYTARFRRYCRDRRLTRGQFRTPLRVLRLFDERESMLRRELLDELTGGSHGKSVAANEQLIMDMHKAGLITISRGREWASRVWIA